MAQKKEASRQNKGHMKGHNWTRVKLERVTSYLPLFTKAVKGRYRTIYIDAFAGTGKVDLSGRKKATRRPLVNFNFPSLIDGSARMALHVVPRFDRYVFNDNNPSAFAKLTALRQEEEFQDLRRATRVTNDDANACVRRLCKKTDWTQRRAVLFLDPRGLQVEWATLEAVARTGAIDVWYLFPLGIGVNRLLCRDGQIDDARTSRLDCVFGSHAWYRAFYKTYARQSLFGRDVKIVKLATFKTVSAYFVSQLEAVFPCVAEKPLWLYNRAGNPMYLLCFVTADPEGQERLAIAQKILSIPSTAHDFPSRLAELLSGKQR